MKFCHSLLLPSLLSSALAADVLSSSGFTNCDPNANIRVNHANITFDRSSGTVFFDVSGTNTVAQNVTAELIVTAYGQQVYNNAFNPCEKGIKQLCPVPTGTFSANGSQVIPANFLSQIPSIAFTIPDLEGEATLKLNGEGNKQLGCIEAGVTNGKTVNIPAVPYVAAGVAAAALALTGFAALGSAGLVGAPAPSVTFSTVIGWFQSMQMNGMHSVNYPPVYRAFTKNFAFSGGLVPWDRMQTTIDNFRASTGGNLTDDNVAYLRSSTLVFSDGSNASSSSLSFIRRGVADLDIRDFTTSTNGTSSSSDNNVNHIVHGIGGYVEQLTIPQANTFMTVLLIFAIVIAAITVAILLFKVILEAWALFGSFPKRLVSFRKRYWLTLAKTITSLILLLYGIWVLYCIFQFTNGDSWAAKVLAAVTLATFTGVLAFFTIKIILIARRFKKDEGDASALYQNKETWVKYSLFYDSYKQNYWWLFIPAIIYMFAKGCVLAATDGHGLTQTAGLLIVESLMLILLLWTRPFATRASQIINIFIQVVRVLSVVCILVFVEELGIAQTTKTITGVVLIAVQAGLTGILAILIAVNAIIMMCRENPHRKKRKEAEKLNREFDNLTPLDPRNSLLVLPLDAKAAEHGVSPYTNKDTGYTRVPNPDIAELGTGTGSTEHLVPNASAMAQSHGRPYTPSNYSTDRDQNRDQIRPRDSTQPTFPIAGFQHAVPVNRIQQAQQYNQRQYTNAYPRPHHNAPQNYPYMTRGPVAQGGNGGVYGRSQNPGPGPGQGQRSNYSNPYQRQYWPDNEPF